MTSMGYTIIAVICFIASAALAVSAVMFRRATNDSSVAIDDKQRYERTMKVFIGLAIALGILTVVLGVVAHNVAFAATDDVSSGYSETTSQVTTGTTVATTETTKAEEPPFEKGHFKVDLQKEDMGDWAAAHGFNIEELRTKHSTESAPAYGDVRNEKILLAMREYISPTAIGFTDGVAWPMEDALRWLYKNSGWSTLTDKDKWDLITEHGLDPYDYETIVNPTLCDMRLQDLAQSEYFSYMVADNEWLQDRLAKNDGYFAKTEEPIGNSNFYYKETEDGDLLLEDDQLLFAIRLCELERNAYVPDLDNPVQCRTSIKNWHLPPEITDANLVRTELAEYQESFPALILYLPDKSGKILEIKGRNLLDKRVEIFEVPKPTPTSTETTTTTSKITTTVPSETTTTTRKTTVTTEETDLLIEEEDPFTIKIKCRYWNDGATVYSRKDPDKSYDKTYKKYAGDIVKFTSPDPKDINRSGYHLMRQSDKKIRHTVDGDWEYIVWYVKDDDTTIIIDYPQTTVTTVPPPPVVTTKTTRPDGLGGKDPSQGETLGSNRPGDGQDTYESPEQTTIHDYVTATTTLVTTVPPRPETDASGNVTATNSSTKVEGGEKPTETAISTVSHGTDKVNGETVNTEMNNPITAPAD